MCTMCAFVQSTDPDCRFDARSYAVFTETTDAAAGTATTYTMAVGDTFVGGIGVANDRDGVRIYLEAGQTYTFELKGAPSGVGTLADPVLRLLNSAGTEVGFDDDGGSGFESRLTFTATSNGYFFLEAAGYADSTGTYQLTSSVDAPAPVGTLDQLADYLINGYWADRGGSGGRFDTSMSNVISVNITALTPEGQQLARWAMEAWSAVANLSFVETTSSSARITFDDNQSGAFASFNTVGAFITSSTVNVSVDWLSSYGTTIDSYNMSAYIHELGHALGLGHQGHYNNSATYGVDETFANDSYQVSIMSYFTQTENTTVNASYAVPITPMMADIIAIQSMYGASTQTSGNTVYGLNSNLTGYLGLISAAGASGVTSTYAGGPIAVTLYDAGGRDTIDLSFSASNQRVNLTPASFSDILGLIGNLGIARGTVIENAFTGSGNDTIIGNGANNVLRAGDGNDVVYGGAGNDTLNGGAGNDTLDGGIGNDVIYAGAGTDSIVGGDGDDRIFTGAGDDRAFGGAGTDFVYGALGNDFIEGGDGNDQLFGGDGADTLNGGNGNDTIYASLMDDLLYGGTGNDLMFGGDGTDRLYGETGDDTLYGGAGNDVINGGANNDRLYGGTGADTILGGDGSDTINGGPGSDALAGGLGPDVFVFNAALGAGNIDRITDFSVADDIIHLDDAIFAGLALGALGAATFVANTSGLATSAAHRLIYETDTGNLYFDADGSGAGARVHFATLGTNLALTSADFFVI